MNKLFIFAFIYIVLGVLTLELILFHDRNSDFIDTWVDCDDSPGIQVAIVLIWFFPLILILVAYVIPKLLWLIIIKPLRILIETVVYVVKALIEGEKHE